MRIKLWIVFSILIMWAGSAYAQSALLPDDADFAAVTEALNQGDSDLAMRELDKLADSHAETADFHYFQGVLSMDELQQAGRLRMPFIARRMKRHFEEALEHEPDHEFAHFALFQWHQFAPGIIGGSKDTMQAHMQRLEELHSTLRFPARISLLDDPEAEEEVYNAWFEAAPENLNIRLGYITSRINQERFALALQQLQQTQSLLNESPEHQQLRNALEYQWARLAAESGTELDRGYALLTQLIAEQRQPAGVEQEWIDFRLAQIHAHKQEHEQAQSLLQELAGTSDKRLKSALDAFTDEQMKGCCS